MSSPRRVDRARTAAVNQLVRIDDAGAFAGRMGLPADLDARERRFVTELVSGVTRARRWLDFVISRTSGRDVDEVEPALRQILRVGTYEILETQAPDYASVNEGVELAKHMVRRGAGGLVNAVLRKVAAAKGSLPEPDGPTASRLAVRFSHPDWIVRNWIQRFGEEETAQLLDSNNRRPKYSLRVNVDRVSVSDALDRLREVEVKASPSPYLEDFIRVDGMQRVLDAGLVSEGLVAVQDESAGLVVRVLDPRPDETIGDCCAAPGGKLCYVSSRMQNSGRLVAVEFNEARLGLTRRAAEALGARNIQFVCGDATRLHQVVAGEHFDRILVDAPCSGLGVLAKRADLRWRIRPEDAAELTMLQDRLLDSAAGAVKRGGLIVYSTCTIEPAENEARIRDFLARNRGFAVESAAPFVPEAFLTAEGFYASLPHRHGIDGAFAARLRMCA